MDKTQLVTKILFLDCDGVLNGSRDFSLGEIDPLNPGSCSLLREVLAKTGAKVVISSVWRKTDDERFGGWRKLISSGVLTWDDLIEDMAFKTPVLNSGHRGEEIQRWLDLRKEWIGDKVKFAIIDDDSDMLESQLPFFVQTNFKFGMQQKHADNLVELLT